MGMGRDGGLYVYALRLLAYLYKRSLQISLFRSRPAFRNNWRQEFFDLFPSRPMTSQPRVFILASICPRGVFFVFGIWCSRGRCIYLGVS